MWGGWAVIGTGAGCGRAGADGEEVVGEEVDRIMGSGGGKVQVIGKVG